MKFDTENLRLISFRNCFIYHCAVKTTFYLRAYIIFCPYFLQFSSDLENIFGDVHRTLLSNCEDREIRRSERRAPLRALN